MAHGPLYQADTNRNTNSSLTCKVKHRQNEFRHFYITHTIYNKQIITTNEPKMEESQPNGTLD